MNEKEIKFEWNRTPTAPAAQLLSFLLLFLLRALASQKTNEKERKANQSIPLLLFNSQSIALFISAIDGVD